MDPCQARDLAGQARDLALGRASVCSARYSLSLVDGPLATSRLRHALQPQQSGAGCNSRLLAVLRRA
jgi:hypothetical protein